MSNQDLNRSMLSLLTNGFLLDCITKKDFINSICIEGGECTGTTTISKHIVEELRKINIPCEWTREPSEKCKKEFINKMTHDGSLMSPGEKTEYIIDIFMKDRKENQSKMDSSKLYICDRSIFSTIMYQSGILDKNSTIEDINNNFMLIKNYYDLYHIKMPKFIYILTSLPYKESKESTTDKEEFEKRFNLRKKSLDVDGMDDIEKYLHVNNEYSKLTENICTNIYTDLIFRPIEHKQDLNLIVQQIKDEIIDVFFKK